MFKRGLSQVVATVLLILLTLAAVAIIATVLVPFVKNNLEGSTNCISPQKRFVFDDSEYTCFERSSGYALNGVSVKATGESSAEDAPSFVLDFINEGSSTSAPVVDGSSVSLTNGGLRMISMSQNTLDIPATGELRTYVYNSTVPVDRIEIHTKLKGGKVCPAGDTISLRNRPCISPINLTLG